MLTIKIELHSAVTGEVKTVATGKSSIPAPVHMPKGTT
jgi:hypothetical protein